MTVAENGGRVGVSVSVAVGATVFVCVGDGGIDADGGVEGLIEPGPDVVGIFLP